MRDRLLGLLLFLGGAGMIGYNLHTIESDQTFLWKFFVLGGGAAALGLLMVVAGRPMNPETGKPVRWWAIASAILFTLGAGGGAWYAHSLLG
jgi:hypothetical protein